jgi:uncharacterized protein (DUF302 family)
MKSVEVAMDYIAGLLAAMRGHVAGFIGPAGLLLSHCRREPVGPGIRSFHAASIKAPLTDASFAGGQKGNSGRTLDRTCGRWMLTMQATGVYTFTCAAPRPFRKTVQMVRAALRQEGISVPVEIDASARMRRTFGVETRECRVICVDCPLALLPVAVAEAAAISLFPLHVVVASEGAAESCVYLATPPRGSIDDCFALPYERFLGRVLSILVRAADA